MNGQGENTTPFDLALASDATSGLSEVDSRLTLITHSVTIYCVIRSFRNRDTRRVFLRERLRKLQPDVQRAAQRKLAILHAAESLQDLRVPPGNWLERLSGDREGQQSIRVNDQWRVCFRWSDGDAYDVEIVDYH